MKILVTGSQGQLGEDIIYLFTKYNLQCIGTTRTEMDITDFKSVEMTLRKHKPDIIIHCAAYTLVDKAEIEKEECYKVNVIGTKNIVKLCKELNCKLVYISTDYVFDGKKNRPYETNDSTNPINYYGETKKDAEDIIKSNLKKYFIIRVSWLFSRCGKNFVNTIIRLSEEKSEIKIVSDQKGSPTYTLDLAEFIYKLLEVSKVEYGIYHFTNKGICSWYEFAIEIKKILDIKTIFIPISTSEFKSMALRPKYSALKQEVELINTRSWQAALEEALKGR